MRIFAYFKPTNPRLANSTQLSLRSCGSFVNTVFIRKVHKSQNFVPIDSRGATYTRCMKACSVTCASTYTRERIHATRTGVSKCEARFETLLRGPTQWCGEIIKGVHQRIMIEIGDVKKARPGPKG